MATAQIKNTITLTKKTKTEEIKYPAQDQIFTMKKAKDGENLPLLDFATQDKSIAKITRDEKGKTYLQLADEVISALPDDVKEQIFQVGDKRICEISAVNSETTPIEIDEKSNELRVTIKAKDGSTKYTCNINAMGVQLNYGKSSCTYFSEDENGSPKILHPTMSTDCFEEMVFGESSFIKLKGKETVNLAADPKKIPVFMVGTYLQALNPNNQKLEELDGKLPEKEIVPFSGGARKLNAGCEICTLSLPDSSANGFTSYYFWKYTDPETGNTSTKAFTGADGTFSSEIDSLTLTYNTDGKKVKNAFLNINRHSGKAFRVNLPLERVSTVPEGKKRAVETVSVPEQYLEMLNSFSGFIGQEYINTNSTEKLKLSKDGKFEFQADFKDATDTTTISNKQTKKKLNAQLEESETEVEPPPPPPPPEEHHEHEEIPFVPTPKKVVKAKDLKIKSEWGTNAMVIGIILMMIAMPFAPAIAAIIAGIGVAVTAGGAFLALNADRLSNPYLKIENYIIDTLSKHERELENEQEAFWENDKDLRKANNNYNVNDAMMNNEENPSVQYLKGIFGEEGFEDFIGAGGLKNRQAFIDDLDQLIGNEGLTDAQKEAFIKQYFGADGVYGKPGFNLTAEELANLKNKVFSSDMAVKDTIKGLRELNAAQEEKEKLENKTDNMLKEGSDELVEKIIRQTMLSDKGLTEFVERDAIILARHFACQDFDRAKIDELMKKLPDEAKEALVNAYDKIQDAQSAVEEVAKTQAENEQTVSGLKKYNETLRRIHSTQENGVTYLATEDDLSNTMKTYFAALNLKGTYDHEEALRMMQNMTVGKVKEKMEDGKYKATIFEVAEKLSTSVQPNTIKEITKLYSERDTILESAGFYSELARDCFDMPEAASQIKNTPLNTQILQRFKHAILVETKNNNAVDFSDNSPAYIVKAIDDGEYTPVKGSRAEKLYQAYKADVAAQNKIDEQLDFTTLAENMNKSYEDHTYVEEEEVANVTAEALKKYPRLKTYSEKQQKSIIKLALIMDTQQQNITENTGDESAVKDFKEREKGNLEAIGMLLDGSFGVIVKDEYLRKAYEGTPELSDARKKLEAAQESYGDHTLPLIALMTKEQKAQVLGKKPKTLAEFETAVKEVVGNEKLADGRSYETFRQTAIAEETNSQIKELEKKLKENEEKPSDTQEVKKTKAQERTRLSTNIETLKTRQKIALLDKGYLAKTQRVIEEQKRILGTEETQEVYTETKEKVAERLTQAQKTQGEVLHEGINETSTDTSKRTKTYDTKSTKNQVVTKKCQQLLKEFKEIMALPNDNNGQTRRKRLEKLQQSMMEVGKDIAKSYKDAGIDVAGLNGIQLKREMNRLTKDFKFPLPDLTNPKFSWKDYEKEMSKFIAERQEENKDDVTKNEFSLFGGKKPRKVVKAKTLRKNTKALKEKLDKELEAKKQADEERKPDETHEETYVPPVETSHSDEADA